MGIRRSVLIAAALAGVAVSVASAPASARSTGDGYLAALPSGQCLVANRHLPIDELSAPAGRFALTLFDTAQLSLDNHVDSRVGGYGYGIWNAYLPRKLGRAATLCMQADGDLVLRKDGHAVWRTGTAGKAPKGEARLTDGGRLVVRTAGRRVVWSSRTTAVLMIAGDELGSGRYLVNRTYPGSATYLQMRRSGDLVLMRGRHRVWHSDTHVRGSYAYVSRSGRLAVATPSHHVVWSTRAEGRYAILRVAQLGRLVLERRPQYACLVLPNRNDHDCGSG